VRELLRTVNENTGVLMVILTMFYVWYTRRIVSLNTRTLEEVKEQAWLANRAYVVLRLVFRQKMYCTLELANEGRTPARNVRLLLDRDLFVMCDPTKKLNDFPIFSEQFELIPPGVKTYFYLWPGTVKPGGELVPDMFRITATYEALGRRVSEETTLHLHIYEEFPPSWIEESLEKVPPILDEMRKTLEKIAWGLDRVLAAKS